MILHGPIGSIAFKHSWISKATYTFNRIDLTLNDRFAFPSSVGFAYISTTNYIWILNSDIMITSYFFYPKLY